MGKSTIYPTIRPPCPEGMLPTTDEKGEAYCYLDLGEKKEGVIGIVASCSSGFIRTGQDSYSKRPIVVCDPCDWEERYTCPETGSAIQREDFCPEHRHDYKDEIGVNPFAEAAFAEGLKRVRELCGRGCSILTPGIFYEECEKWKAHKTPQQITRTAEYVCKSRIRGETDRITQLHKVSVAPVLSESAEALDRRLRQAAEELKKTIQGCHDVRFTGFRETPSVRTGTAPSTVTPNSEAVVAAKVAQEAYEECLKKAGPTACSR